jgi:hypothetical protein
MGNIGIQQGVIGKQTGQIPTASGGEFGEVLVTELQPRYYQWAYRGNVFYGANTVAQALSVASATFTGLAIANPTGSGKNLAILQVGIAIDSATTGVGTARLGFAPTVALTTGNSTGPTGTPTLLGTTAPSVAKVGASATLGASPTTLFPLIGVTATTAVTVVPATILDLAGSIIVPPGQLVTIDATGTAITAIASVVWVEILT